MNFVIFGLSISSSWGNGHATIWRGLIRELIAKGHSVSFFERDVPYYKSNRDFLGMSGLNLILYSDWVSVKNMAEFHISKADVSIVTSYCPDGAVVSELVCKNSSSINIFYDLDTPVTLKVIQSGGWPEYIGTERGLTDFNFVLSYTGGIALELLKTILGASSVFPLYGCADPLMYYESEPVEQFRADLLYFGTFAEDRQEKVAQLLIEPAKRMQSNRFVIAGAQYPTSISYTNNISFFSHITPPEHKSVYCSSRFTLNVTRRAMIEMGYCPSGRLFESALCGIPILSDYWVGLDNFFKPGEELLVVTTPEDVISALNMTSEKRNCLGNAAKKRALSEHTAGKRIDQLLGILKN